VVIIGGGLAGLTTGLYLAQRGTDVVVVEARHGPGDSVSGRSLGQVLSGLTEAPDRLVASLGADTTRTIFSFTRENFDLACALGLVNTRGHLHVAKDTREAEDHENWFNHYEAMGLQATHWDPDRVRETLQIEGLGPGLHIAEAGSLHPPHALRVLLERGEEAGVVLLCDCPVLDVDSDSEGALVHTRRGTIRADAVVFAANGFLPDIDTWFEDKIYPVRTQLLATAPVSRPENMPACTSQYGYCAWNLDPEHRLVVEGCRWATPHLEVGETDDTRISDPVRQALLRWVGQHASRTQTTEIQQSWAARMGFTCDGLPLIGPLPGRPWAVACAGFNGREPGLAFRAARAVTTGLLEGRDPDVPECFAPRRFV
jgi:glycine/D-amino acid oxidase-like deaminating enzyme